MKTNIFNRPWRASKQASSGLWASGAALTAVLLLLATAKLSAGVQNGVVVGSVCGGGYPPFYGYVEGDPMVSIDAKFHTPIGLALDSTGDYLFVADRDNQRIRVVDLSSSSTYYDLTFTFAPDFFTPPNVITNPVGVALDANDNVYVLNRGNGQNGTVAEFDGYYGDFLGTNSVALTNANAITLDDAGNIYVTASNTLIRITFPSGFTTNVATVTNAGTCLQGLVVMDSGMIAACDSGRNGIYLINPTNGVVSTNTGFNGAGDNNNIWETTPNRGVTKTHVLFNQPTGLAKAGNNMLVVADYGNNRVKVVDSFGTVTNLYGVNSDVWYGAWPGWRDGNVVVPDAIGDVEARLPNGVLLAGNSAGAVTVYVTEDYYHLIRKVTGTTLPPVPPHILPPAAPTILTVTVLTNNGQIILTWSTIAGTNTTYNVKRSTSTGGPYTVIVNTSSTSYTDTNVFGGTTYYYVVSALGAGGEGPNSAPVSATLPLPPVPDPQIGYVDFPATAFPVYTSVFHPVSSYVAYNDTVLVIKGSAGSGTYYTYGYTTNAAAVTNPTPVSASIPSDYRDGLYPGDVAQYTIAQVAPFLTVKAIGAKSDGSPNSTVVKTLFQFVAGNPNINGNNAAQFTISDMTANAHLYYTLDGTDPSSTNGVDLGTVATPTNTWTVGFPIAVDTLFKVRAFRDNYQPSAIVSNWFSPLDYVANKISFGFASGEASSDFVGSPGQFFYAPVTLNPLPATQIYSLQFNLTVTNVLPNPHTVAAGAYSFQSILVKPIPGTKPPLYTNIPPYMFIGDLVNPPPPGRTIVYNDTNFMDMRFTNSALNLLGVGWLERAGKTNLYDTTAQDLTKYSQPHDTLFDEAAGKVVLGGYAFQIPPSATTGQAYQIQIGRPSATSDGIGMPGHDVFIDTPTNGSLTAGPINSIKTVIVGQRKYVAGDCAPFSWFNAGDFGNRPTNYLDNSDVMQVFQSAIYTLNYPPAGSDFYDCMDSCGGLGGLDPSTGYLTNSGQLTLALQNALFDGNDTTINQIAFGNSPQVPLDVCDVYVTFRRSLDPSLTWYSRFWTNGVLEAQPMPQPKSLTQAKDSGALLQPKLSASFLTNPPSINFAAADIVASAGKTVQIPITAKIFGTYPLRVLMLNLTVQPLDGSPALTSPVQFTPNAALGTLAMSSSSGNGNYAATWLNSAIAGLTDSATVGTLTVTIPANAPGSAAYAIHFDHASASPNGIASFPNQTLTGLILLSDRSSSIFNDGIPDSWRLRYFGTVNNLLSQASADADGDGASNWHEYMAGTDPTDPKSLLRVSTDQAVAQQGQDCVIRWPSVVGRHYVIERSTSLYGAAWTPISTITGSGTDMEFHDTTGGKVRFYRVSVAP
jgi:hypothetical protein